MTSHPVDSKAVSILGIGQMGSALAHAFLRAGYRTTIWNRTPGKAKDLRSAGAVEAASAVDCMRASSLLIACLLTSEITLDLLRAIGDLRGCMLLNVANCTPQKSRDSSALVHSLGAQGYLQGAIMAAPGVVRAGKATVLCGGSSDEFTAWQSALQAVGTPILVSDLPERVPVLDNALISCMEGVFSGFVQALALVGAAGIKETEFTNQLAVPLLSVFEEWLARTATEVEHRSYAVSEGGSPLEVQLESMKNIEETAKELGVSTRLMSAMHEIIKEAVSRGKGREEVSSLVEILRTD
ncbi:hypothetical protein BDW66DRAFT_155676 [Aspergillus desertorum]